MALIALTFIVSVATLVVGLAVDHAQSVNRGWQPAWTLLGLWRLGSAPQKASAPVEPVQAREPPPVEQQAAPVIASRRAQPAATPPVTRAKPSVAPTRAENAAAMVEVDTHIAAGRYDQGALLLKRMVQRQPNDRELALKLLEVLCSAGNATAFKKVARGLRKKIGEETGPYWDRVVIMGQQICPGDKLFETVEAAPARTDSARESVDFEAALSKPPLNKENTVAQSGGAKSKQASFWAALLGHGKSPGSPDADRSRRRTDSPPAWDGDDMKTMTKVGTKLDLARAYIDMGDDEGARTILMDVVGKGGGLAAEAKTLLSTLSPRA